MRHIDTLLLVLLAASACGGGPDDAPSDARAASGQEQDQARPLQPTTVPTDTAGTVRLVPVAELPPGIAVPRVAGLDSAVAARVNAALDRERADVVHGREACRRAAEGRAFDYELVADATYDANDLLSIRTTGHAFCGGANGTTLTGALSFDLRTGAAIDVLTLTGVPPAELGALARPHYTGPPECAAHLAERGDLVTVSAAYLDEAGIGVLYGFDSGAAESCGAHPAVIPLAEARRSLRLQPPLDRL